MNVQVSPHDDEQVGPGSELGLEPSSVLQSLVDGVDRARADNDDHSVIVTAQNGGSSVPGGSGGSLRLDRGDDLVSEQRRLD